MKAQIKFKEVTPKYLMLHTKIASGIYDNKKFSLLQSIGNHIFILQVNKKKYELRLFDLTEGLLKTIDRI